jgi:hypothetical protein
MPVPTRAKVDAAMDRAEKANPGGGILVIDHEAPANGGPVILGKLEREPQPRNAKNVPGDTLIVFNPPPVRDPRKSK